MGLRLVWDLVTEQYGGTFRFAPDMDGNLAQVTAPLSELHTS
jgi:hypothetical protein